MIEYSSYRDQLLQYLALLKRWNHVFNLTAINAWDNMILLHLEDSLSIAPFLVGQQMLDVGSGAGLPGIPLAITHPEMRWVLLDKNGKKTRFLMQVVAECHLKNVDIVQHRIETFKSMIQFDSIVSRAFSSLQNFVSVALPLLTTTGRIIAMKGRYPAEELAELAKNSDVIVETVTRLEIKGLEAKRHVVVICRAG